MSELCVYVVAASQDLTARERERERERGEIHQEDYSVSVLPE